MINRYTNNCNANNIFVSLVNSRFAAGECAEFMSAVVHCTLAEILLLLLLLLLWVDDCAIDVKSARPYFLYHVFFTIDVINYDSDYNEVFRKSRSHYTVVGSFSFFTSIQYNNINYKHTQFILSESLSMSTLFFLLIMNSF